LRNSQGPERLPLKLDSRLTAVLGTSTGELELHVESPAALPYARFVLPRPVPRNLSLVLRVHSAAGIPLASATIAVNSGEHTFDIRNLTLMAMEGYAHLDAAERHAVVQRVWSRRAFATGSIA